MAGAVRGVRAGLRKAPRQWGHRLYKAFVDVLEQDSGWPRARDWEVEDIHTDWYETRLRKLVDAHEEVLPESRASATDPSRTETTHRAAVHQRKVMR